MEKSEGYPGGISGENENRERTGKNTGARTFTVLSIQEHLFARK